MMVDRLCLFLICLTLMVPGAAAAQRIEAVLQPDTVRVGDLFQAVIRIDLPADHTVVFPDSLVLEGDLDRAGSAVRAEEPLADGGERFTVAYPLSAWRPGQASVPPVPIEVTAPDTTYRLEADFPALEVRSVLPAEAEGDLAPRPPKDVLGPNYVLWPYLVAGLLALLTLAALLVVWQRRRRARGPAVPVIERSPRERAIAALDETRAAGLLEAGDFKTFYSRTTDAVRYYLDELEAAWGAELTTSELITRLGGVMPAPTLAALEAILESADLVKFAKHRPRAEDAQRDWARARDWVVAFDWGEPETSDGGPDPAAHSEFEQTASSVGGEVPGDRQVSASRGRAVPAASGPESGSAGEVEP